MIKTVTEIFIFWKFDSGVKIITVVVILRV